MIDIKSLKDISNTRIYQSGQIIIRDGDRMGNEMYIILRGKVDIYKNYREPNELKITSLNPGDFFGEMSLFLNKERTATVVTAGEVILMEINRMSAYEFFEKQPEATYSLIKTLCLRLEETNKAYEKISSGNDTEPAAKKKKNEILPQKSTLFPEGHKTYELNIEPEDAKLIYEKSYECPLCGNSFSAYTVRESGLKLERNDYDFRPHHLGVDTLYYDVITCPDCWYSAFASIYKNGMSLKENELNLQMVRYKKELRHAIGGRRNVNDVFLSLYLALVCAPLCLLRHELITARLWMKLHWLYHDCNDEEMELYAAEKAQKAYITSLETIDIQLEQLQLMYIVIGELSIKLGDYKTASHFYYQAKTCKSSRPILKNQADDRITELRELIKNTETGEI